jgi:hypothetical protein
LRGAFADHLPVTGSLKNRSADVGSRHTPCWQERASFLERFSNACANPIRNHRRAAGIKLIANARRPFVTNKKFVMSVALFTRSQRLNIASRKKLPFVDGIQATTPTSGFALGEVSTLGRPIHAQQHPGRDH